MGRGDGAAAGAAASQALGGKGAAVVCAELLRVAPGLLGFAVTGNQRHAASADFSHLPGRCHSPVTSFFSLEPRHDPKPC